MNYFLILPSECLITIIDYLTLEEIFRYERIHQATKQFLQQHQQVIFFQHYLQRIYFSHYFPRNIFLKGIEIVGLHEPRGLLSMIGRMNREGRRNNLIGGVLSVSSMDRAAESPENIVKGPSLCLPRITAVGKNPFQLTQRETAEAYYIQMLQCGCGRSSACYWGSAPSRTETAIEYITFGLKSSLTVIEKFSVRPYQAFWHPNAPCYGPKAVALQFLLPSDEPHLKYGGNYFSCKGRTDLLVRYRNPTVDLADHVYYSTPPFSMQNKATLQEFVLPEPMLCIGGCVRVVFYGMHQRQTVEVGEDHHDDYYICISDINMNGYELEDCQIELIEEDSVKLYYQKSLKLTPGKNGQQVKGGKKKEDDDKGFFGKANIGKVFGFLK